MPNNDNPTTTTTMTTFLKERPILFSTEMVKAILDDRKTQTRRIIKPQPEFNGNKHWIIKSIKTTLFSPISPDAIKISGFLSGVYPPHGLPGDVLWVRETFMPVTSYFEGKQEDGFAYKSGDKEWGNYAKWKSPRFMPKAAARIWLEITDVKIERLQDISENDAMAEGVQTGWNFDDIERHASKLKPENNRVKIPCLKPYQLGFLSTWCNIHSLDNWIENPWVWVITFKVLSKTGKPQPMPNNAHQCQPMPNS